MTQKKHSSLLPDHLLLFGMFECVSGAQATETFACYQQDLAVFRSQGMPFVKIGSKYAYPVELCHRFFAGQNYHYGFDELMRFVDRAHADKLPPERWYTAIGGERDAENQG